MGLVDAIFAMENAGFKTNVFGKGKVISQSLLPGEKLKLGTQVAIELN
jgi:cell division protein FtsI (penicillin-binding protein 3)